MATAAKIEAATSAIIAPLPESYSAEVLTSTINISVYVISALNINELRIKGVINNKLLCIPIF